MGHPEEVDVIVAGGGPAGQSPPNYITALVTEPHLSGCVVAGRLAYADPNLKVMLIEGKVCVFHFDCN
jgi:alcohol oxidase